jgi:hypothetical protein
MIARGDHAAYFFLSDGGQHERLSEIPRIMGGIVVSAQIIQFVRDRRHDRVRKIGFRSLATADNLVMADLDTAPCEAAWPKVPQAESCNG